MYKIKKMKNGIEIIYKKLEYLDSVNLGVFIKCGSLTENISNNGISHLLEHMIFKGTNKRTAKDIALDTDRIGGEINAYTSSDYTCLYMKTLSNSIYDGMDILFDMISSTKIDNKDLEMEKQVIFDEIDNCEDDPDELALDLLNEIFYKEEAYRYNVLGRKENLLKLDIDDVLNYKKDKYTGSNIIISIVGNFDEEKTIDFIKNNLVIDLGEKEKELDKIKLEPSKSSLNIIERDFEQITGYINLSKTVDFKENKKELILLNNIFGGSISSKLFQSIREEKGLTYNINSFVYDNEENANINIYFTCNNENILEVNQAIIEEINKFKKYNITDDDLSISKKQLISEYLLNIEDPYEEMITIGEKLLLKGKIYEKEEIINSINDVKIEDLTKLKDSIYIKDSYNIIYVGNISNRNASRLN